MAHPIRVLLVEDNPADAELIVHELERSGFQLEWWCVETEEAYLECLRLEVDVILSDFEMPRFSALRALELAKIHCPDLPFLVVSGKIGEETAILAMKHGATDYLFKDRLARIGPAVRQALEQTKLRRDRRLTDEALKASEEKFRSYVEHAPLAVLVTNAEGIIEDCNPAAEALFGYTAGALKRMRLAELHGPDEPENGQQIVANVRENGSLDLEHQFVTNNGHKIWVSVSAAQLSGDRVMAFCQDISRRKKAERWLAMQQAVSRVLASAETLRTAARMIMEEVCEVENWDYGAIWQVDKDCGVLRCSEQWGAPSAVHAGELVAARRRLAFHPGIGIPGRAWLEGRPIVISDVNGDGIHLMAGRMAPSEYRSALAFPIRIRDEITGVVEFFHRRVIQPDEDLLAMFDAIGRQIGQFIERKKAEEELKRFVSLSPAMLYAMRLDHAGFRTVWVSDNVLQLTGYTRDESLQSDWCGVHLHPDDLEQVMAAHPVPYEIEQQVIEFRFQHKDGRYIWIRDEMKLVRSSEGIATEVIGAWTDVSDRVQLEEQYRQAQKMEAMGTLAGGVAHDFNNLLSIIHGYSSLMVSGDMEQGEYPDAAQEIAQAAERAAGLTRQLLLFSRKQVMEPVDLDVNEVVENVAKMLRRIVGEDVALVADLESGMPLIHGDVGMLEQVLLNFAANARDAMPNGGKLCISTSTVVFEEKDAQQIPEVMPGQYVVLNVSDTGCGIPKEKLPHIFEPFFTTKEVGRGTGLGLATVYGIVKQHHGWLTVLSEVDKGTTFEVFFPGVEGVLKSQPAADEDRKLPRGRETILLVEDEASLRVLIRNVLERCGYTVLDGASGIQALALWKLHRDSIQLLLTDMVMPDGMTGRELAIRLTGENPQMKTIYMSGYNTETTGVGFLLQDGVNYLQKPFVLRKLAHVVRSCLDGNKLGLEWEDASPSEPEVAGRCIIF